MRFRVMSRRIVNGIEVETDEACDGFALGGILLAAAEQTPGQLIALTVQPLVPANRRKVLVS